MDMNKDTKKKLKLIVIGVIVFICLLLLFSFVLTDEESGERQFKTRKSVEKFVLEGVEVYRSEGLEVFGNQVDRWYIEGEFGTYLYILDFEGDKIVFNPAFPNLEGIRATTYVGYDGKKIIRDAIFKEATTDGKWVSYNFIDPKDEKPKTKEAFVVEVDNYVFGAGIYNE